MYHGKRYAPTFVVEVDELSCEGSLSMRNKFFPHGVRLGWLIDSGSRSDCQKMYEYYCDENGQVQCCEDTEWRTLDGRDALPDFKLLSTVLDMALNQDPGSSSSSEEEEEEEEEEGYTCLIPGCGEKLRLIGPLIAHVDQHRSERAIQKFLKREKQREMNKMFCQYMCPQ